MPRTTNTTNSGSVCQHCSKILSKRRIKHHEETCSNKKIKQTRCTKCAKRFTNVFNVGRHERNCRKSVSTVAVVVGELKTNELETTQQANRIAQTESREELANKLISLQEELNGLKKEKENLRKRDDNQISTDARIAALTEQNRQISSDYEASKNQLLTSRSEHDSVVATLKSQLEAKTKELSDKEARIHHSMNDNQLLNDNHISTDASRERDA